MLALDLQENLIDFIPLCFSTLQLNKTTEIEKILIVLSLKLSAF